MARAHGPLLIGEVIIGEVSKFAGGDRPKPLGGRELGEIDSVKKVAILIDVTTRRMEKGEWRKKEVGDRIDRINGMNGVGGMVELWLPTGTQASKGQPRDGAIPPKRRRSAKMCQYH